MGSFLDTINLAFLIASVVKIVFFSFIVILPMVAYSVYAERRVSAIIQDRVGPNRTGIPADALRIQDGPVLRRPAPADGGRPEVHPQGGLHAGAREQVLLLARALPHHGAGAADRGGGALRQRAESRLARQFGVRRRLAPPSRQAGHRGPQRGAALHLRHRLARRLRHRARRLVVEFEVSLPRRRAQFVADDLV